MWVVSCKRKWVVYNLEQNAVSNYLRHNMNDTYEEQAQKSLN